MAYTINANAKNVWIRDNEDTRDLSIQTDASSVYLDNGRTLEQELGEGSMVSNVVTVDSGMSKVIDGTLDGVYESGVMYGRTLVNSIGTLGNFRKYSDIYFYCDTKGLIKPSAKYYYQIKNLPSNCRFCIGNSKSSTETFFSYQAHSLQGTVTTKTTQPDESVRVWIYRVDDTTNDLVEVLNEIELVFIEYQEGMENWDIPFFTGLCDVKMPILRNFGKNLLNSQSITYTLSHTSTEIRMKNSLKPNVKYTISFDRNGISWAGRSFYVKGEGFSSYRGTTDYDSKRAGITFSLTDEEVNVLNNDDKSFLQLYSALVTSESLKPTNIQIEESSTRTVYEDHKTNILTTPEEIVLRSLPNGVQDTYNLLTGEYVKRIGEVVLDGSEGWSLSDNLSEVRKCYVTALTNVKVAESNSVTTINNRMSSITYNLAIKDKQLGIFARTSTNGLAIVIDIEKLIEFKTYLQQNPITVQYELATPITTTVKSSGIPFAYENGHVILESGSEEQSLLPTLKYSTVVNRTGQVESVTKTIVKQETQITELEKMLVQGIIGMDYNNTLLTLNLEIDEVI